jgi:predicted DNA-binding transcriptional regulator AlpA
MSGRRSPSVRIVEIAELLGVTKQRAHQIAEEKGFPSPVAEDARGRVWSRYEVQAWAKRWRVEKPWRSNGNVR